MTNQARRVLFWQDKDGPITEVERHPKCPSPFLDEAAPAAPGFWIVEAGGPGRPSYRRPTTAEALRIVEGFPLWPEARRFPTRDVQALAFWFRSSKMFELVAAHVRDSAADPWGPAPLGLQASLEVDLHHAGLAPEGVIFFRGKGVEVPESRTWNLSGDVFRVSEDRLGVLAEHGREAAFLAFPEGFDPEGGS